jgi:hypothetical protein
MFNANETVAQTIRRLLDGGYDQVAGRVLEGVTRSVNADGSIIQTRLAELEAEAEHLTELGMRLRPENAIVRALVADLETVMGRNAGRVDGVADELVLNAVDSAAVITRQLALPNFDPVALRAAGLRWVEPDAEAVAQLVSFVDSPAWGEELAKLGANVPQTVRNQVIAGFAQGMSPARIARILRDTVQTLPRYEADRIMRTTQLQSYRSATAVHQNANVSIIDTVYRMAALDGRTCLACIALSGTVIWNAERDAGSPIPRVDVHHFGRCTSLVQTKGTQRNVPDGVAWFNSLSDDQQLAQMGNAKYKAFKAGQVELRDFVATRDDAVFDMMIYENSLKGVLGEDAQAFYK